MQIINYAKYLTDVEVKTIEEIGRTDKRRSSTNVLDFLNGRRRLRNPPVNPISHTFFYECLAHAGVQNRKTVFKFSSKSYYRWYNGEYEFGNPRKPIDLLDDSKIPNKDPLEHPKDYVAPEVVKEEVKEDPAIPPKEECRDKLFIDILQKIYEDGKCMPTTYKKLFNVGMPKILEQVDQLVKEGIVQKKENSNRFLVLADKEYIKEYLSILVPCEEAKTGRKTVRLHRGDALRKCVEYILHNGSKTPTCCSIVTGIPYKTCFNIYTRLVKQLYLRKEDKTYTILNMDGLRKLILPTEETISTQPIEEPVKETPVAEKKVLTENDVSNYSGTFHSLTIVNTSNTKFEIKIGSNGCVLICV